MFLVKTGFALLLLVSLSSQAQVYRCGNEYSAAPCAGGREVDVSSPLSDPAGPKTIQVFLCRKPGGSLFWISERCANRGWALERSEWVPRNLDWDDQVAYARGKRDAAAALTAETSVPRVTSRAASGGNATECRSLDERVNWLDSLGRAGGGGYTMDWIRSERKIARDKQFRLHC